jgi:2'-hydroxyisoflavone reductase
MGEMLAGVRAAMSGDLDVRFTWVPSDFLQEQKIGGWIQLPVWVPAEADNQGFSRVSVARAIAKGLTFRPLADTAAATLAWHRTRPEADQAIPRTTTPPGAGLAADREAEVLRAWRAKKG